jgi:hypothetical protein
MQSKDGEEMASPKQVNANQRNSQKSTGPKSEDTKAIVSKNAVKHGLLSKETLLPWEDGYELGELRERLIVNLNPQGELELILTDRIVSLTWRLCRAGRIETAIFVWRKYSLSFNAALTEMQSHIKTVVHDLSDIFAPTTEIVDEQKYLKASQKVAEQSALVNSELPALGRTFVGDADTFSKLHRYETGLERSLFNSLHELQRVQAGRAGGDVPLPLAVDVHGGSGDQAS